MNNSDSIKDMADVDRLTWADLQNVLRDADETLVHNILLHECTHKRRLPFMLRMHSRYNKMRMERERNELAAGTYADYIDE